MVWSKDYNRSGSVDPFISLSYLMLNIVLSINDKYVGWLIVDCQGKSLFQCRVMDNCSLIATIFLLLVTVTTSLLQEPRLDPDCNQFKDFLIDHPCLKAKHKGETTNLQLSLIRDNNSPELDPFPVSALPTCNHAEEVCSSDEVCSKKVDQFKRHCPVRGDRCVMTDV